VSYKRLLLKLTQSYNSFKIHTTKINKNSRKVEEAMGMVTDIEQNLKKFEAVKINVNLHVD
jgi:hypothetical protein